MITAFHSLVLASNDLAKDVAATSRLLGVTPSQTTPDSHSAQFDLGNIALIITASGEDEGLVQTCFSITDRERWQRRLKNLGLSGTAEPAEDTVTAAQRVVYRGLDLGFTADQRSPTAPLNDSCFSGVDHVVVSTNNPDASAALFGARLGLDMRLDLSRPDWNARLMFFRVGDAIMEVVQSADMPSPPEQDRFYGISWRTADAEAARTRVLDAGFSVSEVREGRKPGTRVFTVRDAPCGVPTLVIQPPAPR